MSCGLGAGDLGEIMPVTSVVQRVFILDQEFCVKKKQKTIGKSCIKYSFDRTKLKVMEVCGPACHRIVCLELLLHSKKNSLH